MLRFRSAAITPGGKGVNVARVARALGASAVVVGFVPGLAVARLLAEEGIELCAVPCGGEVRSTAAVIEDSGRVTIFNEPGPSISVGDWGGYESAVERRLGGHSTLVCTGSTPPGAPPDAYARLVALGRRTGCRALVDATGPLLREALGERPAIVTPNVSEAASVVGRAGSGEDVAGLALELGADLIALGAETAVVTAGAAGLALVDDRRSRWLPAPRVHVRNPLGAGDSFVGGLVTALEGARDIDDAVCLGAATAAASVAHPVPGGIDRPRVRELAAALAWREP